MAHLRKKGTKYYAEFYDPTRHPVRKWVALRTGDKQAATHKMVRLDRDYAQGGFDPWEQAAPEDGVAVTAAVDRYLASRKGRRAQTRSTDRYVLDAFARSLPPATLVRHVEPRHVGAFLDAGKGDGAPLAPETRNSYLGRVRTFLAWCADRGLRKGKNPADAVERAKVGRRVVRWLRRDEAARLLAEVESSGADWLADAVRVALGTGLRGDELCHLQWAAVDLRARTLTVARTEWFETKSGHERSVPLEGDALDALRRLHEARGPAPSDFVFPSRARRPGVRPMLDRGYLNKRFKVYAGRAGLSDDYTFHSLRKTFASWLAAGGVSMYKIQRLLGHADLRTTIESYAHLAPDAARSDVRRVFGNSSSGAVARRARVRRGRGSVAKRRRR